MTAKGVQELREAHAEYEEVLQVVKRAVEGFASTDGNPQALFCRQKCTGFDA
jgi:hypothetical protein